MSANPKRKMCWNCEANIELGQEVCSYCQTSLDFDPQQQMLAHSQALYPSQYSQQKIIQATPFATPTDDDSESVDSDTGDNALDQNTFPTVYTLGLLIAGSVFFLFGLVLLLFSSNGKLTLCWNSSYWYLYLLLALPMLYFSFSKLAQFSEE